MGADPCEAACEDIEMGISAAKRTRLFGAGLALSLTAACEGGLDMDFRGDLGSGLDTTAAAQTATTKRPEPDSRGVISYPGYQVAVAKRGDTLVDVATRVGIPAEELGRTNGIAPTAQLRQDEIIALPYRVADSTAAAASSGVDIASLAGGAISKAEPGVSTEALAPASSSTSAAAAAKPATQTGPEPIRHKVKRGETAFTIARLYNVSVRALAEWNGLGSDFTIRENQTLLIPPTATTSTNTATAAKPAAAATAATTAAVATNATTKPGEGSPTPTPPSASKPLPEVTTAAEIKAQTPETPDLGAQQTQSKAAMGYPVSGKIIRPYVKGKNNGIDIAGTAGASVMAAADGKVAAITTDADDVTILVLRHPNNLMTVYYNVEGVKVAKGAQIKRGQSMAVLPDENSYVHFEVREGFDSVDPTPFLK